MNRLITLTLCLICFLSSFGATPILGTIEVEAEKLYQFVKQQNPSFEREIAENFITVGRKYGIRGDIALCQSIIETGWFKYKGSAVTPDQHNYCGLGVTSNGMKGESFNTIKDGVTAQIQHLYAYCCTKSIPYGETLIDPRFKYVDRGCAPNWEDLGGKWAMGDKNYGVKIVEIFNKVKKFNASFIEASNTNISITAPQDGESPVTNVSITGSGLSQNITYTVSSDMFIVSTGSNWNNLKGGILNVKVKTNVAAGKYNGYIDVKSGKYSTRINLNATIKSMPIAFTEGWNCSQTAGSVSAKGWDATLVRNLAYYNEKLYLIYQTSSIKVIDSQSAKDLGSLNLNGVNDGTYKLCDVTATDKGVIACNLVTKSPEKLKVYYWENDKDAPKVLLETSDFGGISRIGDCMSFFGTMANGKIVFGHDDRNTTRIIEYTVTNGKASTTPKVIKVTTDGSTHLNAGTSLRVIPESNGYWLTGKNCVPTFVNKKGVQQKALSVEQITWGNNINIFPYKGSQYAFVDTYSTPNGSDAGNYVGGRMRLYDITNSIESAEFVADYPSAGLGNSRNINCAGSIATRFSNDFVESWVCISGQGVAYYKTGNVPQNGNKPEPPVSNPELKASATSMSFATLINTPVKKQISISGSDLTEDIKLSISGNEADLFSLSASKISKNTTATVTVTYNPSFTGSHSAVLNITSKGAASIEVQLSGKAESESAEPDQFTADWCFSAVNGQSNAWMNPDDDVTRNMALKGNNLYIARKGSEQGNQLVIVDAYNGTKKGSLDTNGARISWFGFSSVANMGGTIVACDLANGAGNMLSVYAWNDDNAAPKEVLKTTNHGGIRLGDLMSASGNINNGKLWFGGKDSKIYVYKVSNGTASDSPEVITLKDNEGNALNIADGFSVVGIQANEDGTFWATGKGAAPMLFNANGKLIRSLAKTALENNTYGTSFCTVKLGSKTYAVANSYNNGVKGGKLNFINITNGEENAELVQSFPELGKSDVSNGTFITTAIAVARENKIHMWTLIPHQGIAKYTAASITSGCRPESVSDAEIVVANGTISVSEENAVIDLISINGMRVAHSENSILDINDVQKGIYVVVATLESGERITKKIAIM